MTTHDPRNGHEATISIPGAQCGIWYDGPVWNGSQTGTIGRLVIEDPEAGRALIELAVQTLKDGGRDVVLAPMDGDTWHAYRAVVETDGAQRFPLEPWSGEHDTACLEACGFDVVGRYVSSRAPVPDRSGETASATAHAVPGITVTPWDGEDAAGLLDRLYAVASTSFAEKSFYKDVSKEEFLSLYGPLLGMINPRMVLFAFDRTGRMVGFLFGYADAATGSAVLKTYAAAVPGVGRMLSQRFHDDAAAMGFDHVIHALMHVDNASLDRSAKHGGTVFRRYALYARTTEA